MKFSLCQRVKKGIYTVRAKMWKSIEKMWNRGSSTAPFRTDPIASMETRWNPIEPTMMQAYNLANTIVSDFVELPNKSLTELL